MTSPVQLREEALAALLAAKGLAEAPDTNQATFDKALGEFRSLDRQARSAAGAPQDPAISLADAEQFYTGKATGSTFSANGLPMLGNRTPYGNRPGGAMSLGSAFVEARQARLGFSASTPLLEPGSTAVATQLRLDPISDPRQASFVWQMFAEQEAVGGTYSYMRQVQRILRAAVVQAGDRKPTSTLQLRKVQGAVEVIAHVTDPVSRFDLLDAPMLRIFIDSELRLGLDIALDELVVAAILADGTPGAGTVDAAGIRSAITDLQVANYDPKAIVLSPTTWQAIEAEVTDTTVPVYPTGQFPTEALSRRLYGLPVVVTNSVSDDVAIVGSFDNESAVLMVTGPIMIDISDAPTREIDGEAVSGFQTNELICRGERRANLALSRPTAFIVLGGGS